MAVQALRKISNGTLIAIVLISSAIFGLFYFGGDLEVLLVKDIMNPKFTGELITWMFILLGLCMASMLGFGITQFFNKLRTNPKASLTTLGMFVGFGLLLLLTYSFGDDTPFPMSSINPDTRQYNTEFWLKIIDMWIFSIFGLIALSACVIVLSSIKKALGR